MKRVLPLLLPVLLILGACSTTGQTTVANKTFQLSSSSVLSVSPLTSALAAVAAIYVVYDPLAPNWEIEESRLNDDTYRLSLKMKRYHTGGAGESIQILKRRASQLQYEQGFANYQILEYTEGIDSQTTGARRVAEGTIRLVQRQQADSFMQNVVN